MKVMIEVQQNSGQKVFDLILEVIGKQLNQDQMMHIIFSGKIFIHFMGLAVIFIEAGSSGKLLLHVEIHKRAKIPRLGMGGCPGMF